jgi:hypothetical protein
VGKRGISLLLLTVLSTVVSVEDGFDALLAPADGIESGEGRHAHRLFLQEACGIK